MFMLNIRISRAPLLLKSRFLRKVFTLEGAEDQVFQAQLSCNILLGKLRAEIIERYHGLKSH